MCEFQVREYEKIRNTGNAKFCSSPIVQFKSERQEDDFVAPPHHNNNKKNKNKTLPEGNGLETWN